MQFLNSYSYFDYVLWQIVPKYKQLKYVWF